MIIKHKHTYFTISHCIVYVCAIFCISLFSCPLVFY